MSKYRVKLNLSDFYDDERKYAYVLINSDWTNVKCLQKHIKYLFNLNSIRLLTEDGFFLSPLEDINVIKESDALRVISRAKISFKVTDEHSQVQCSPAKKKCRKNSPDLGNCEASTPMDKINFQNRKDKPIENTDTSEIRSVKKLKDIFDPTPVFRKSQLNIIQYKQNTTRESVTDAIEKVTTQDTKQEIIEDQVKSVKRKRRKRKKLDSSLFKSNDISIPQNSAKKDVLSTAQLKTQTVDHIRFNDDEKQSADEQSTTATFTFKSYLDNLDKIKPRIIKAIDILEQKLGNKNQPKGIQLTLNESEQMVIDVTNQGDELIENGRQKELDTTLNLENDNKNTVQKDEMQQQMNGNKPDVQSFKISDLLNLSEPLEGYPSEGDILLFKIYCLNEKYEPLISDFICGKYEGIDENMNCLKIFVIDGQDQIKNPKGKFSLGSNEDESGYMYIKLEDMLDKKVFK